MKTNEGWITLLLIAGAWACYLAYEDRDRLVRFLGHKAFSDKRLWVYIAIFWSLFFTALIRLT